MHGGVAGKPQSGTQAGLLFPLVCHAPSSPLSQTSPLQGAWPAPPQFSQRFSLPQCVPAV
jgi:hypothetical protein